MIASPGYNEAPAHARMLARHGYGVLLFDQRGEGRSDGDPNGWGWAAEKDMVGAIRFLQAQPGRRTTGASAASASPSPASRCCRRRRTTTT